MIRATKAFSIKCNPIKRVLAFLASPFFSQKILNKIQLTLMTRLNNHNTDFLISYASNYRTEKVVFNRDYFMYKEPIRFENSILYSPRCSDRILTITFGEKYMDLPPIEKRITHNPYYVKFSDGEDLFFK